MFLIRWVFTIIIMLLALIAGGVCLAYPLLIGGGIVAFLTCFEDMLGKNPDTIYIIILSLSVVIPILFRQKYELGVEKLMGIFRGLEKISEPIFDWFDGKKEIKTEKTIKPEYKKKRRPQFSSTQFMKPHSPRLREKIEAESPRIKRINELNLKYPFYEVSSHYNFYRKCVSKSEFDRTDLDAFFACVAKENIEVFKRYDKQVEENIKRFAEYQEEYSRIEYEVKFSDEKENYKTTELAILQEKKKTIIEKYDIIVYKKYSSPYGRNRLSKRKVFQREDVEKYIKKANEADLRKARKKAEIAHERSLMTAGLSYDIKKRDNFRCVLCGASAADGVQLHVDHIIPVSKGGKTIPSNLRTLCDWCNLGKRDKYDPYGPN